LCFYKPLGSDQINQTRSIIHYSQKGQYELPLSLSLIISNMV
jgi:hypothetical protein